ncbi:hypothetical protein Taro_033700 [Colocasia esculenta]|uniref:Uncharacterized protein n=1 Tax=Colocasia esculenta TaxID=4460 RepID=A0A843W9R2_COLES|nr:hypothetical protein [Colocasia esculenta]
MICIGVIPSSTTLHTWCKTRPPWALWPCPRGRDMPPGRDVVATGRPSRQGLSRFGRGRDIRWRRNDRSDRRDRCPFCQNGSVGCQAHVRERDVVTRRDRFPSLRDFDPLFGVVAEATVAIRSRRLGVSRRESYRDIGVALEPPSV